MDAAAQRHAIAPILASEPADTAEPVAPALLADAIEARGTARARAMHTLADLVRERLVRGTVRGAEWAVRGPCSLRIEGRSLDGPISACGLGHVPEQSRRFLYFYTMKRREPSMTERRKRAMKLRKNLKAAGTEEELRKRIKFNKDCLKNPLGC